MGTVPAGPLVVLRWKSTARESQLYGKLRSSLSRGEEEVQVGDGLIIMNGMDVTMLAAVIQTEKEKPMRKFVFA